MSENSDDRAASERHASDDLRLLHQAAEMVRGHAYAPYSGFDVGAAVRTSDGCVITAGNVENIVYGSTMCAERAAIFRAIARVR